MEDQLVLLSTALLAEKKGYKLDKWFNYSEPIVNLPTQSLLQKWLRDVHKIIIVITFVNDSNKWYNTKYTLIVSQFKNDKMETLFTNSGIDAYEDALELGIFKGLKYII